jgi:hypothetical protein
VEMSPGEPEKATRRFSDAERIGRSFTEQHGQSFAASPLSAALDFNRAQILAVSNNDADRKHALSLFKKYMRNMPPTSPWWPQAFDQYVALSTTLKETQKPRADWEQREIRIAWIPAVMVRGAEDGVYITQEEHQVEALLGQATMIPVAGRAPLHQYVSERSGFEAVCASGKVVCITLRGPRALPVTLKRKKGSTSTMSFTVGMPRARVEELAAGQLSVYGQILEQRKVYEIYPNLGIALYYQDGKVSEIVIANYEYAKPQ